MEGDLPTALGQLGSDINVSAVVRPVQQSGFDVSFDVGDGVDSAEVEFGGVTINHGEPIYELESTPLDESARAVAGVFQQVWDDVAA